MVELVLSHVLPEALDCVTLNPGDAITSDTRPLALANTTQSLVWYV